ARRPPCPTLFPYTPLFRSPHRVILRILADRAVLVAADPLDARSIDRYVASGHHRRVPDPLRRAARNRLARHGLGHRHLRLLGLGCGPGRTPRDRSASSPRLGGQVRAGLAQVEEPDLSALVLLAILGDQTRLATLADVGFQNAGGGAEAPLADQCERAAVVDAAALLTLAGVDGRRDTDLGRRAHTLVSAWWATSSGHGVPFRGDRAGARFRLSGGAR